MFDVEVHRSIDEIDRPDHIVRVVESLDEVAKSLGCVSGQVKHIVEAMPIEQIINKLVIAYCPFDELRTLWHILFKAATQVIEDDNLVPRLQQMLGDVRSDKSCSSGDQRCRHGNLLSFS